MPWQWTEVPDATDAAAEKANRLTVTRAAEIADRYPAWVNKQIRRGELQTVDYLGRRYIDGRSLAQLLAHYGVGYEPMELADELEVAGRYGDANEIRRAMQDLVNTRTPGYDGPMRSAVAAPALAKDVPDPGELFLRKYGQSWGGA